ncbi:hypothetical protein TW65_06565 [Stemphylium lycopersici]|nr:hypothetical protein TW65_06565 [Stemphylium lycopersici]
MSDRDRNTGSPEGITSKASIMTPSATPSPPPSDLPSSTPATFTDSGNQGLGRELIELRNVCRPKPPASRCLEKEFSVAGGLYFQNIAEAQAPMERAQWRTPVYDDTVPKTNEEAQIVVKRFVEAMKDMSLARDTLGSAYRKRMTTGGSMSYEDWAIEACAWDILRRVISIHTEGFKAPIYDKTIVDHIGQTQEWTFRDRINWICVVLMTSKSVVVTLMKNEKIWTIIGAPHKLYNNTLVNSVSNAHRGVWVKTGRKADAEHQARTNNKRQKVNHIPNNQDADTGKATKTATTSPNLVFEQPKARRSKYDISSPPAIPAKRNMYTDTAPVPLSPLTSNAMTAFPQVPAAIDERPDAEMIALMYGPLPTRGTPKKVSAGVFKQDADKDTEGVPVIEADTVMETTKDVIEDAIEAASKNGAKENNPEDSVDIEKAPHDDHMDEIDHDFDTASKCETNIFKSQIFDEDTLEGARLLASLHTAG